MAISTGTTVTREVSSKTQTGLSELIARAFSSDEAFGFDKDGLKLVNNTDGTHQQSTIDVNWKESVNEVKQVFTLNPGDIQQVVGFAGVAGSSKVHRIAISGSNASLSLSNRVTLIYVVAGITRTLSLSTEARTYTASYIKDIILEDLQRGVHSGNISSTNSVNSTTFDINYTQAAGDAAFRSSITVNNGSQSIVFTATSTTTTAFEAQSKSAVLTMEVEKNVGLSGAKVMEFSNTSNTTTIAAGQSLTWNHIANQEIGMILASPSCESRVSLVDGNYQMGLASGFANSTLTVKATISRPGETDVIYRDVGGFREVDSTNTDATAYVANVTETNGTILVRVEDPEDGQFHTASITVPEDTAITEVETIIRDAIKTTIIGTDSLGKNIYMSSIVKITIGDITTSAGISSFTITFDWASSGTTTNDGLTTDVTGLTDPATDAAEVSGVTAGTDSTDTDPIDWKFVTTSSTLQPGGDTSHFATLVFTK